MHGPETEYVFYDGPPFANGLPHYGHLLTGFVKDAVPRYQTMLGHRVERRFGWDCHGLPAEMAAEQELGLSGRQAVIAYGIDRFNSYCGQIVQRTTDAWERYVTRQARWVSFEDTYKTMDLSFMESVLWAFKRLYDKGLAYEGFRVLPYCWECETPLSNFETRQDDSYRDRTDPAVTVRFDLEPVGDGPELLRGPLGMLAWTTTPWTLPSNLALAVGPELRYTVLQWGDGRVVIGEGCLEAYADTLSGAEILGTVTGAELVGRRFRPLFGYFSDTPRAFVVLGEDFVSMDEGTGIVQMAPGFGEDDQRACDAAGIAVICPVDDRGRFTAEVGDLAGVQVFDANAMIVDRLGDAGALVRAEDYTHSYPHCWRTDTPLIYRAMSSWFVRVTAIKDRMVDLNQQIAWVPEHVRDGAFGKWLEGARDWSISRNRFWGTPIPVWKSDDPRHPRVDVYGSIDELAADFGVRPDDLHRPFIDELTRPNPDDPTGVSTMRRIPDVLDCWFDSGSMPFAQLHYPFEHAKRFEEHFPADFIVEYVGQTRGWFYTLHVLATALFDRPPFKACIAHGIVLGDDGRKLSKRLRNFPDPEEVFAAYGADAMRWYLLSSPVLRGSDVTIEEKGLAEPIRLVCNPIWNTWYFLSMYANADGLGGRVRTDQTGVLDRYVLAKTRRLVEDVTAAMDTYDLAGATGHISSFLDALTNWYVRRSRDRFWRPVNAGATPSTPGVARGPARRQAGRLRHAAHGPRGALPGRGTIPPVSHRGRLPGADRAAQRAPRAVAGRRRTAFGPRPRRGHGPRPRGVLGRPFDPQGGRAPGAPAVVVIDGGGAGCKPPPGLRGPDRRRGERAAGQAGRDSRRAGGDRSQRHPCRARPEARSTHSARHRRNEERRLVAALRRHGGGRRGTARAGRIRAAPAAFGPGLQPDASRRGGDRRARPRDHC